MSGSRLSVRVSDDDGNTVYCNDFRVLNIIRNGVTRCEWNDSAGGYLHYEPFNHVELTDESRIFSIDTLSGRYIGIFEYDGGEYNETDIMTTLSGVTKALQGGFYYYLNGSSLVYNYGECFLKKDSALKKYYFLKQQQQSSLSTDVKDDGSFVYINTDWTYLKSDGYTIGSNRVKFTFPNASSVARSPNVMIKQTVSGRRWSLIVPFEDWGNIRKTKIQDSDMKQSQQAFCILQRKGRGKIRFKVLEVE